MFDRMFQYMDVPILQAELRHQRRGGRADRRGWLRWLTILLLGAGLASAALLFAIEFAAAASIDFDLRLTELEALVVVAGHVIPSVVLIPITALVNFVLMFRTLTLSSDVIAREERGGTWHILLLTDQSPARIAVGKWWATVANLAPQYGLLTALRVGVSIYLGLERYRIDYFYYGTTSRQFLSQTRPLPFPVEPMTLIGGAALIALFTFGNLLFTAALGVLVSSLRRTSHAGERLIMALGLRAVILVVPAALLLWLGEVAYDSSVPMPYTTYVTLTTGLSAGGVSLLDNGSLVSAALLADGRLNFVLWRPYTQYVPIGIALFTLGFYALITGVALRASVRSLRKATP